MPQTIQLQIPPDGQEGDILTCHYKGQDLEIPIPLNSQPGDILEIQLATDQKEEYKKNREKGDEGVSSSPTSERVNVGRGIALEIHTRCTTHASSVKDSGSKESDDGTHAMVWPAGRYLAQHLSAPAVVQLVKQSKVVVELGSGLGIGGLAFCATVADQQQGGYKRKREDEGVKEEVMRRVFLTDVPAALPLLQVNVTCNHKQLELSSMNTQVQTEPLIWGQESTTSFLEKIQVPQVDLVLASDLLYNTSEGTYKNLVETIVHLLNGVGNGSTKTSQRESKLILAVRWRKPQEERKFFELMVSHGIEFELLPIGDDGSYSDLAWHEYGNPACAKSNEFFTYTKVKVHGEYKALKDIGEEDMDQMDDEEFQIFESKFLQIYAGTF